MTRRPTRPLLLATLVLAATITAAPAASAAPAAIPSWCAVLGGGGPVMDIIGDSTAAGAPGASQAAYRWPTLLLQGLRADGYTGAGVWTGAAVGGATTQDYMVGGWLSGHVDFAAAHKPPAVLLMLGINDRYQARPTTVYRDNLVAITRRIQAGAPNTLMIVAFAPWVWNTDYLGRPAPPQEAYRDAAREAAAATGSLYLGLGAVFTNDTRGRGLYAPDLIHHSDHGQAALAAQILRGLYGPCPDIRR